jgi:hypothetical protein
MEKQPGELLMQTLNVMRHSLAMIALQLTTMTCVGQSNADPKSLGSRLGKQTFASVCGPQCIQRVLETYGIKEKLTTIIYEIQWPDLERGTSMADLISALERRGISVKAARVPLGVPVVWPHPVIIHYPRESGLGHYAVLTPADGSRGQHVWYGPSREGEFPANACFWRRSEIVLLTSSEEITNSQIRKLSWNRAALFSTYALGVEIGIGVVLFGLLTNLLIRLRRIRHDIAKTMPAGLRDRVFDFTKHPSNAEFASKIPPAFG